MTSPSAHADRHAALGRQLQAARERAGLALEVAALKLHMPARILQALEAGQWQQLGAAVHVRGQVRSYARLLGLDAEALLADAGLETVQPAAIVSRVHVSPWERFFNQLGMKTVYVVMTLGLVIPVWMALTRSPLPETGTAVFSPQPGQAEAGHRPEATPVAASMAALPKPVTPGASAAPLRFEFAGESWVQFHGRDGQTLERGLMKPGDVREFSPQELGRVVLGNASQVRVLRNGEALDMSPWLRSNVARFAVSSQGHLLAGSTQE